MPTEKKPTGYPSIDKPWLFSNAVRKNVTGVKKSFLKLALDKGHFITGVKYDETLIKNLH